MEVKILKFDHFGRGLCKANDKIIFVNRALPGEIVDIQLTNQKKSFSEAKIKRIIQQSHNRVESLCPYYNHCGGCDFWHTTYEIEKQFKINKAKELLGRCDKFYETKYLNYRNKVTLHVQNNHLGYYQEKTNNLVAINYCYLLDNYINKVINDLNEIDLSLYAIEKIVVKSNQDKILMDITGRIDRKFVNYFDYVDTIINNKKVLRGSGYIEELVMNKSFKIASEAFFQVNTSGLINIFSLIQEYIKSKKIDNALDLYSGTGLWGILISPYVQNVTSIEINKEACLNALDNLKKNNITNVKIINGDVKNYIDQFENIDLVITDPPRSGLDKKTLAYLKKINAKYFIYISCDMQTLKRDLKLLSDVYEMESVNLVDMFKKTYHVETVCLLCRKTFDK